MIEIWSDWTQTQSKKNRYIKPEAKPELDKQICDFFFFFIVLMIFFVGNYNNYDYAVCFLCENAF